MGQSTRPYCIAHGTLLTVMWQSWWEESLEENGYIYLYGWVLLLSTWNYHNIVHRLYESESHLVVSSSLQPHGLYSSGNSPGQNTGVGSHSLLQGIEPRVLISNPGIEPRSLALQVWVFNSWATRKAQEHWSGQPIPSPADLPDPGIKPGLLHCRWILYQLSYPNKNKKLFKK